MKPHRHHLYFRIFYGSVYFLLYVLLAGLVLVTPADAIERSLRNSQNYNIWIIIIAYVATFVIVCFAYVLRLYVSKTVVASIPKNWVPIDKGDVKDVVYRMISAGLARSAAIAYEARPRVEYVEADDGQDAGEHGRQSRLGWRNKKGAAVERGAALSLPVHNPVWGEVEHNGWASPTSPDLPNLQYCTVLSELPNLIEAKAMTLAPSDATSQPDAPVVDPEVASLLQRTSCMSLRTYLDHLIELGVVSTGNSAEFVSRYEQARFSDRDISNTQFRELMHLFAELLREMRPLDFGALDAPSEAEDNWSFSHSERDDERASTPQGRLSSMHTADSRDSIRRPMRNSSANAWSQYATAPNTPGSRHTALMSRKASHNSLANSRPPYPPSQTSSSSLRSGSSGSGSVIRLATREDRTDMPYILSLRETGGS